MVLLTKDQFIEAYMDKTTEAEDDEIELTFNLSLDLIHVIGSQNLFNPKQVKNFVEDVRKNCNRTCDIPTTMLKFWDKSFKDQEEIKEEIPMKNNSSMMQTMLMMSMLNGNKAENNMFQNPMLLMAMMSEDSGDMDESMLLSMQNPCGMMVSMLIDKLKSKPQMLMMAVKAVLQQYGKWDKKTQGLLQYQQYDALKNCLLLDIEPQLVDPIMEEAITEVVEKKTKK